MTEERLLMQEPCGPRVLRLIEKHWQGQRVLDLRLWYFHDASNEYRPDRRGIQMQVESWRCVLEYLLEACAEEG